MKIKIKTEKSDWIILSEIFGNFQFFVEKKNLSPSLQKPPNPNPNLKKNPKISLQKSQSPSKNLNLPIQIPIYPTCFLPLEPNTIALLPSASLSLPQKSPNPKSKNYRKTLRNYRIPITKMLQFCPSFGASLLQALKDSHFLPLSLASDALSRSLCTLTPPCV